MREIKFRGVSYDTDRFIYGSYLKGDSYVLSEYIREKDARAWREVIPGTVGQFTGAYDSYGTDVYDGDIIKTQDGKDFVVHWRFTEWVLLSGDSTRIERQFTKNEIENSKIIGNVLG